MAKKSDTSATNNNDDSVEQGTSTPANKAVEAVKAQTSPEGTADLDKPKRRLRAPVPAKVSQTVRERVEKRQLQDAKPKNF